MLIAKIQNSKSENLEFGWNTTENIFQHHDKRKLTKPQSLPPSSCLASSSAPYPAGTATTATAACWRPTLHRVQCTLHILPWCWCLDVQVLHIRKHYLVVQRQYKSRTWSPRRGARKSSDNQRRAFHHLLPQIHSIEYCLFNCVQHHLCHSMTH